MPVARCLDLEPRVVVYRGHAHIAGEEPDEMLPRDVKVFAELAQVEMPLHPRLHYRDRLPYMGVVCRCPARSLSRGDLIQQRSESMARRKFQFRLAREMLFQDVGEKEAIAVAHDPPLTPPHEAIKEDGRFLVVRAVDKEDVKGDGLLMDGGQNLMPHTRSAEIEASLFNRITRFIVSEAAFTRYEVMDFVEIFTMAVIPAMPGDLPRVA